MRLYCTAVQVCMYDRMYDYVYRDMFTCNVLDTYTALSRRHFVSLACGSAPVRRMAEVRSTLLSASLRRPPRCREPNVTVRSFNVQ